MTFKTIAIAATAAALTATTAAADSFFSYAGQLDRSSTLDLGVVAADADGVVEIYDYRTGEPGALLGTEEVNAGANHNVRVAVGIPPYADVIAVLKIDGQIVATRDYDVARD